MQNKINLPSFLKYKSARNLTRLGRGNDGGYLIPKEDIERSEILISFGINDDWSFEKDFYSQKKIRVLAYDASINSFLFFKNIIKNLLKFYKPSLFINSCIVYFSYKQFFRGKIIHKQKFLSNKIGPNYFTLNDVLKEARSNKAFLKIDIEGDEYRVLEEILKNQKSITGLIIEFHDFDLNLDKVELFCNKFDLNVVHIHVNNFGQIIKNSLLPTVIEVTFSSTRELLNYFIQPHDLDMPNNKNEREIEINDFN
jgi:hypothetical protein